MVNLTAENRQCGAQKGRLESPAERLFYGYGSTFVPIRSSWKCLYDNSRIFLETKFRVRMKAIRAPLHWCTQSCCKSRCWRCKWRSLHRNHRCPRA